VKFTWILNIGETVESLKEARWPPDLFRF